MQQAPSPEGENPTISVVIVNWNRRDYIKATLEDVSMHWYPGMEVVVVDNASTDGTPDMIAETFPSVRLIRLPENVGQCKGLNIGLAEAGAEIVVSLDNDATFVDGSIERILAKFQERPGLAVLHGRIIDFDHRGEVWWWGWYGHAKEIYAQQDFPTPWNIAEGLCALRRQAVLAVGGFPEEYFIMAAGRDLAIKLIDAGYEIRYTPEIAFLHKASAEREKTDRYRLHSDRRMYYKLRNELWTLWKYYPWHQAVGRSLIKTVVWAGLMTRRGSFRCYARAMWDAYKAFPAMLRLRKPAQRRTIQTVEYSRVRAMKELRGVMAWYYIIKDRPRSTTEVS